ncbi:oligosaccharide flippase family protein [Flavobacteriaceae bacterium]|nr:oligosaccharide flippase family protein [Flavobacteriaceae bacterium]
MPLGPNEHSLFKKLFAQTFVYGIATVLPRMLSFLLLPLYTNILATAGFGEVTVIFSWFALFNVLLAYGMETAFFRFYTNAPDRQKVVSTSLWSIVASTFVFVLIAAMALPSMSSFTDIKLEYLGYAIAIMGLDALVVIPFAKLRAEGRPMKYALLKTANVGLNLGLNILFLVGLPFWSGLEGPIDASVNASLALGADAALTGASTLENSTSICQWLGGFYRPNFEIAYIFIANTIASASTFIWLSGQYKGLRFGFDTALFKRMIRYALPVMIAGVAFTINEVFDKILLAKLLPVSVAASELGKYAACYKLALFMTLFATAFRMGIEPFFFSHAKSKNPQRAYAVITQYFVIFGSVIFLGVLVYIDLIKLLFIRNSSYWEAIEVVPLILLASLFLGIYHNLSVWYKVTDQTHYGAYISIGGALITLVVNFIGIPIIGYYASAIATLAAYGTMAAASYMIGRKKYPINYPLGKIAGYLSTAVLLGGLSFYVFPGQMILGSLFLVGFILITGGLEYKNLKKLRSNED